VVPAMHGTMFDHPIIKKHMKALSDMGITVMNPRMEERSAKIPDVDEIVAETIRTVGPRTLENRRILVISGATEEHIDDMRTVSNTSTGSMGIELAKVAHHLGADVELWLGMRSKPAPVYLPTKGFTDTSSLEKMVASMKKVDIAMVPAAIADFRPKTSKGKISSKVPIDLHLTPTPKLLGKIAKRSGFTVGFKAESRVSDDVLKERAITRMKESGANIMVANDLEKVGVDRTEVFIIEGGKDLRVNKMVGTRREVAGAIWERVLECL
jgi:phosphopantothenoylcysteine decarboxylase/phosphopantothenate--cysteine ligase